MAARQLPPDRSAGARDPRRPAAPLFPRPAGPARTSRWSACRASTASPGPSSPTPTAPSTTTCWSTSCAPTRRSASSRSASCGRCRRRCASCCSRTCAASPSARPPTRRRARSPTCAATGSRPTASSSSTRSSRSSTSAPSASRSWRRWRSGCRTTARRTNARYFEWLDRVAPHLAEIQTRVPAAQAADNLSVSNAITSLRSISDADWPEIVAATSVLTRLMLGSPAFAAERDDTRDQTLHAIELLARKSGQSEREVATTLLGLMRGAESSPESGDVDARTVANYWLRGAGRGELRRALGLADDRSLARHRRLQRARPARLSQRDRRSLTAALVAWMLLRHSPALRAGTSGALARRAGGAADALPGIGGGRRDRQPPDQRIDAAGAPAAPRPRRRHPARAPDDGRDPGDADLARERPRARARPRAALPRQPRAPRAVRAADRLARQRRQDRRRATPPCSARRSPRSSASMRSTPRRPRSRPRFILLHRERRLRRPSSAGSAGSASAASSSS